MAAMDFLYRDVPSLGRVHRLGLASNYGIDEASVRAAIDRGVNYFFYTFRSGTMTTPLRDVLQRDREKYVVATLPMVGFFGGSVRRGAEAALKQLRTDYLDVFQLGWLGVTSAWTESTIRELRHLKETGKVKALGVSIHDRERAGRLADDSPLDLLMIRYNAAHPGAERDIFPHLAKRKPAVVAYTATSWRKLLKAPRGWTGKVPTAGDCYRFCLSSPHVDVVLTGPSNKQQLDDNLAALEKGPLSDDDMRWMREFGKVAHG
jgi:aryl-alcohol dehydrogenase-like predicted oxidoreductase